jgi:hypothetical protein
MSQIYQSINLSFCEGGSDKVYQPAIVDNGDNTYDVVASYGRRGATLQRAVKRRPSILTAHRKPMRRS